MQETTTEDDQATAAAAEEKSFEISKNVEKDDEGLLKEYDVIVCGTGLVQAILASALARAGKTVLHCDGDDLYGELDAVWTLDHLMKQEMTGPNVATGIDAQSTTHDMNHVEEGSTMTPLLPKGGTSSLQFHSFQRQTRRGIQVGSRVKTPYGEGVIQSLPFGRKDENSSDGTTAGPSSSITVALDQWNLANGQTPLSYFGMDEAEIASVNVNDPLVLEEYLQQRHQIQGVETLQAEDFLNNPRQARYFALDVSPVFVLASGRAVNGMLASNVADYLEFKTVEGLLWLDGQEKDGSKQDSSALLSRVPCSKNDVFTTKLLSPMDKRRLMKFLQLAMDYATQLSVAEEILKEQHKAAAAAAASIFPNQVEAEEDKEVVQSLNERHLNQGRSLARPQNKAVATEDLVALQQYMQQPDATLDGYLQSEHKLSPRLRAIIRYALAMEIAKEPTSLSQGMSQLRHHLQALGRYGTTAFLVPMYGSGELSQAFSRSAAVFGATYLLRRAPIGIRYCKKEEDGSEHVQGVVIAPDTVDETSNRGDTSFSKPKTIRCDNVVVPRSAMSSSRTSRQRILRRISLLTGGLVVDGEQRHLLLLPPGSIVTHHSHAIHGITMDDSVQVAPPGCTVLHLTTTISSDDADTVTILDQAARTILEASGNPSLSEIYSATYSYALPDIEAEQHGNTAGLHVCSPNGQVLTADVAFEQAERIFHKLCPGQEFLGLSDELDAAIKERAAERGHQDEERLMLESALGMIGSATETIPADEGEKATTEATYDASQLSSEIPAN